MSESLTDKLTRHGMAAASSHVYSGEAELLFAARARIAELEAALRDLLAHDDARFGWEGEPSDVEKRCRAVLENRQAKLI